MAKVSLKWVFEVFYNIENGKQNTSPDNAGRVYSLITN